MLFLKVFTVIFDQSDASLMNKIINLVIIKKSTGPNLLNGSVYGIILFSITCNEFDFEKLNQSAAPKLKSMSYSDHL